MAKLVVNSANGRNFGAQVKRVLALKMAKVFDEGIDVLLQKIANDLRTFIASSSEFKNLSGRLVGEFGFTPEEVANLDRILDLLLPGNQVTDIELITNSRRSVAILKWVNFDRLRIHPFAQHDLTKGHPDNIQLTETISWVDWLENGATITGYSFSRPNAIEKESSRSGEGIMRADDGIWTFQPTQIFKRAGNSINVSEMRRGFGIVLRNILR